MAAQFNGVNQGLSVAAPRSQFRNKSAASVGCWARFDQLVIDRVMMKFSTGLGSNTTRLSLGITSGAAIQVGCRILDSDSSATHSVLLATPPEAGDWHHYLVAVNYTTRTFQLYYDGALVNTTLMTAVTAGNTSDTNSLSGGIGIANPPTGNAFWSGSIEDMKFFDRIISPAEALTIYTMRGRDHIWEGITGYWPLNDLGPSVAIATAVDVSGLGGAASPIGAPVFGEGITSTRGRPRLRRSEP